MASLRPALIKGWRAQIQHALQIAADPLAEPIKDHRGFQVLKHALIHYLALLAWASSPINIAGHCS